MMRKLPDLVDRLFACLLSFLLDIEDEPDWHAADSDAAEEAGEGERFSVGKECLDRLAQARIAAESFKVL